MTTAIAIVGMACRYPDAQSPLELWETVLARRRAFRKMPDVRLDLADYSPRDASDSDSIYPIEAAVIEDYHFDRSRFRVSEESYAAADTTHWLALDVASKALADAGLADGNGLPRDETGVIIGNTLTGEFSRAGLLRHRWPYVRRVVRSVLDEVSIDGGRIDTVMAAIENQYKSPFPAPNSETLAGGLSNTIAGRICNHYNLRGGGFTVDGACCASALAVISACTRLATGEIDVAIAGGVDLSLDPFELIGFARNDALAREEMRVFDARSNGFWPGEGCGMLVLMRRDDARAQGRRIYASIRGWAMSTDGQGGLTRPTCDGQVLAMSRAYRAAGFGPESVAYFEGHGTGTTVGDRTELEAIAALRRNHTSAPPASVSSIKANIGHTKAAAGLAGVINAAMALHSRIIPPIAECERPHPVFAATGGCLAPSRGRLWPAELPLRAGVSSMGFGGINTHLALEGEGDERPVKLDGHVRRLLRAHQDAELFLFAADTQEELAQQIRRVLAHASGLTRAEMADAAGALSTQLRQGSWRAAVVAKTPTTLSDSLESLEGALRQGASAHVDPAAGAFLGFHERAPRIVYLFPGQASPVYLDGGAWTRRFGMVDAVYRRAALSDRADAASTEVAQVAITAASIGGLAVLHRLGLRAGAALGHSLGELTALRWAGAFDTATLLCIARERGKAMRHHALPGAMAAIAGVPDVVERLLEGTKATVACDNGPTEQVVAGTLDEIMLIADRAGRMGLGARQLGVSHAFHTPRMAAAVAPFCAALAAQHFVPLRRLVLSTVSGRSLDTHTDLREHLAAQITHPVRFAEAVTIAAQQADLFIEVGPGQVLSRLAKSLTGIPAVAIDAGGSSFWGLLTAVGDAFVRGAPLRVGPLVDRFLRPFDFGRSRRFLINPCEAAPRAASTWLSTPPATSPVPEAAAPTPGGRSTLDELRHLIARRLGLPVETIGPEHRLLGDLHLNSIQVAQLIAEAARLMGRLTPRTPMEFANVTVADAAEALSEAGATNEEAVTAAKAPAGIDKWVRAFRVTCESEPLVERHARRSGSVRWTALIPSDHPLKSELDVICAADHADGPVGIIAALPANPQPCHAASALAAVRRALELPAGGIFVLIHHGGGGGALARTLSLESPELAVCLVELPIGIAGCAAWAVKEASEARRGFSEARYGADGSRLVPGIELLDDVQFGEAQTALGPGDLLLVTGGGKGIGAEAALALAQRTGARVSIIGRSDPQDRELSANLARMRASGITVFYRQADVADGDGVRQAIEGIVAEQGPITGFLHAAGVNQPVRLSNLNDQTLFDTLSVKWAGACHVLAALDGQALRLLIGFGSIIARTGLVGEAHYGLANEWLCREIEQFAFSHPHCRCLCVEWSVWAGTGMGERLGVLDSMAQQGIDPVSIESGTAMLLRLVTGPPGPAALVVAGRFGLPPTVRLKGSTLPLLRFLETPLLHYPQIELVAESVLSSDTDPYLGDHALSGVAVLPVVFAFEAAVQVASVLLGATPTIIDGVALREAITVPHGQKASIRLAALRRSREEVDVAIRTASTQFLVDHHRCTVRAGGEGGKLQSSPQELEALARRATDTTRPIALDPGTDLYGRILFHGGRFRRIRSYRLLNARECVAEIAPAGDNRWFGEYQPGELLLGDPGARDAALHALQACVPHRRVLPVAVERVELGRVATGVPLLVVARERHCTSNSYYYDLEIRDRDGVIERWTRLELRSVEALERPFAWPAALAATYIERRVSELLGTPIHVGLIEGAEDRSNRRRAALAAAGMEASIHVRPDGKPELAPPDERHVSVSHTAELTLAVVARAETGCDVVSVTTLDGGWREGLSSSRADLVCLIAERAVEERRLSAARVWAADECLRKVRFQPEMPLLLEDIGEEGAVVLRAGSHRIVTLVEGIGRSGARFVIAVSSSPVDPLATIGVLPIEAVA